ncbi:hypothetical protein [Sinomonas halotolerans]|uniref:Uncharacterized protein n=1 Tax=Sinomonas halotolerans TaxID=1644133 RepID=A0ABU9WW32_9MICC
MDEPTGPGEMVLRIELRGAEELGQLQDAAQLLADLDATELGDMDETYYRTGFDALQLALRDVLETIHRGAQTAARRQW